jgi:hypothetical protein
MGDKGKTLASCFLRKGMCRDLSAFMIGGLIILVMKGLLFSPMTYDDCISKYSKNTASSVAARMIVVSCDDLTSKHRMKKNFNDCILKNMQGVMNDVSAFAVIRMCRDKYSPIENVSPTSSVRAPDLTERKSPEVSRTEPPTPAPEGTDPHTAWKRDDLFKKRATELVPDVATLMNDPGFFEYVRKTPVMRKIFVNAVNNRDAEAFAKVCNAYRSELYSRAHKRAEATKAYHGEAVNEPAHSSGSMKRWVDEKGNVHFSGTVGE